MSYDYAFYTPQRDWLLSCEEVQEMLIEPNCSPSMLVDYNIQTPFMLAPSYIMLIH